MPLPAYSNSDISKTALKDRFYLFDVIEKFGASEGFFAAGLLALVLGAALTLRLPSQGKP